MRQPILSICIPTYNRACCLKHALQIIKDELLFLKYDVEVIISDNNSSDDTETVARAFLDCCGGQFKYIRNNENIGMDRNFLQCVSLSRGKYIWLLGDDDYLAKGIIERICSILASDKIGLLHIDNKQMMSSYITDEYDSLSDLLDRINVNITFISANIFSSSVCDHVDGNRYIGSFLLQVPYYIAAASNRNSIVLSGHCLECGADASNNGGYNFARVFFDNYLGIIRQCYETSIISKPVMNSIKHSTLIEFYRPYIFRSLIGLPSQGLDMSGCVKTSFKYYWSKPYYYGTIAGDFVSWLKDAVKRRLL